MRIRSRLLRSFLPVCAIFVHQANLEAQSFLEWKGLKPGPHAVGFQSRVVEDPARTFGLPRDYMGRPRADFGQRPIQIVLWYPASSWNSGSRMTWGDYLPLMAWTGPATVAEEDLRRQEALTPRATPPIPELLDRLRAEVIWARRDASPAPGRFPVLVYAPGGGYPAFDNSVLCEFLASYGYLVIATPPIGYDHRPVAYNLLDLEAGTRDLEFLVGYARSLPQVDPGRIAAMGFSWGGIVSGLLTLRNADIKALVSLDSNLRDTRVLPIAKGLPAFDPGHLRVPVLGIHPVPEHSIPDFQNDFFFDQAIQVELTRASFLHMEHHDFASFSSLLQRCAVPGKAKDWSKVTTSYEFLCRMVLGFLDTNLLGKPRETETDESVVTISQRAAQKAPPSIQDFQGILQTDGLEKALDLLGIVKRSSPEALATFEPAINQAGYEALGRGLMKEALELFHFNTECFKDSWNAWDSLGEAQLANHAWDAAKRCYREARATLENDANLPAATKAEQVKRIDGILSRIPEPAEK